MKSKPRLIFMGTPEFAVPSLEAIHQGGYPVVCVVTQPDRPKGRKQRLTPPAVKIMAEKRGYSIFQPESIRSGEALEKIRTLEPDTIVVVAFGAILSKELLEIPPLGVINIHASLLPRYRGPAPIQWALINGEKETGVTAMQMDKGLDTGDILGVSRTLVHDNDTAQTLHDRLSQMGAALLAQTLEKMRTGALKPVPQDPDQATYAPMLRKSDGHIDWKMPAEAIERRIRGLTPWPVAFTVWDQKTIRVFKARVAPIDSPSTAGTVIESEGALKVAAGKGVLELLELQAASGRRMPVSEFLLGKRIPEGTVLS